MADKEIAELSIRDGVVREPDHGYILACDPELEADDIAHTHLFKYEAGSFTSGQINFNAHTCCFASSPSHAIVVLDGVGNYGIRLQRDTRFGNIFKGTPDRKE